MQKLSVFTDGGARGNPGPAAIGVVIKLKVQSEKLKIDEEKIIASFGKCIGETTNNVAEYTAVIEALRWIRGNHRSVILGTQSETWRTPESRTDSGHLPAEASAQAGARMTGEILKHIRQAQCKQVQDDRLAPRNDISFFLDSSLVVNQLNGLFKIKDKNLQNLAALVHQLETEIKTFPVYTHIPREKNWQADKLVNSALDSHVPSADIEAQKE